MDIIWFEIEEQILYDTIHSCRRRTNQRSCLEAKSWVGWAICRLRKRKAKVLLNLFIHVLPFNHLVNVFFSPICTCIWGVLHWVLLHPKSRMQDKNLRYKFFRNTSDEMNNLLIKLSHHSQIPKKWSNWAGIVGQENYLRFEPNWWKVWKEKNRGETEMLQKSRLRIKEADHSKMEQDNKEGTRQEEQSG